MCRFIETLRVENGKILNLRFHYERMNRTFRETNASSGKLPDPAKVALPCTPTRLKYHFEYNTKDGTSSYNLIPYHPRIVRSLRLIQADHLDYHLKYADRQPLDSLFDRRAGADDVLIVQNGCLTDTTIANIALFDGRQWFTPIHPLLKGTRRAQLLEKGFLIEKKIPADTIFSYRRICMLNAMLDFHEIEFEITPATIIIQ